MSVKKYKITKKFLKSFLITAAHFGQVYQDRTPEDITKSLMEILEQHSSLFNEENEVKE